MNTLSLSSFLITCSGTMYWTTEQGCLSPSSVGRSELDHRERELAPTSTASSVLLFVTSSLPGFLSINYYQVSTVFIVGVHQSVGKSSSATGRLVPSENFSKPLYNNQPSCNYNHHHHFTHYPPNLYYNHYPHN